MLVTSSWSLKMKSNGRKPTNEHTHALTRSQSYRLNTALMRAVGDSDVRLVKDLLGKGANVNFQNRYGETPLSSSAAWNEPEIANVLLAHGANPNTMDRGGGTVLMWAAQHSAPSLVKALLANGADPSIENSAGQTALMHSDWRGRGDSHGEQIRK